MEFTTTIRARGWTPGALTSRLERKECGFMTMKSELTIVIPAKNEKKLLPYLLDSLCRQDYPYLPITTVLLADAGSTDGTRENARSSAGRLPIQVIQGGLPAVGRNAGARQAKTPYVLFVDADIELDDPSLLRRALETMKHKSLHCL